MYARYQLPPLFTNGQLVAMKDDDGATGDNSGVGYEDKNDDSGNGNGNGFQNNNFNQSINVPDGTGKCITAVMI